MQLISFRNMTNNQLLETIKGMDEIYTFNDDFFSLSLLNRIYVFERRQTEYVNLNVKRYELLFERISYLDMYDA